MDNDNIYHILPTNDCDSHSEGMECKCKPDVIQFEGGIILVVHNSFDGREIKQSLLESIYSAERAN